MRSFFDTNKNPKLAAGLAPIVVTLLVLPWRWPGWAPRGRITNIAILYVLLALGLNIVVGFAGLLDLGYIAFYAGAYVYGAARESSFPPAPAVLGDPPIGAGVACMFGVLLGAPTLKLRGDYLAIVTLGFGEIIRIFLNNLSQPIITTTRRHLLDRPVSHRRFQLAWRNDPASISRDRSSTTISSLW